MNLARHSSYHTLEARIQINNQQSNTIPIRRRTRQGCPLSSLLFSLCIEPLTNRIWFADSLKKIQIVNKEYKVSLFVDDLIIYLTDPKKSLHSLTLILQEFTTLSCLKSEQIDEFNNRRYSPTKNWLHIQWVKHKWWNLHILITMNLNNIYKDNYTKTFRKIKDHLNTLHKQSYAWFDRISITKMFIILKRLFHFKS